MCGIAGIMSAPGSADIRFEELQQMIAMLSHRGPDGYGMYRDRQVGLAHSRLSIIDFATGAQPLSSPDGTLWLSFNGEIFNFIELRRELTALGHHFTTSGDSEVIIHCYDRWGPRAFQMLNGQFAFALWDTRQRQLWLVRDRLGILPLHYAMLPDRLLFASEAKALFAGGRLAPRLDPEALSETFITWATRAPRSAFSGVHQVPPGTALCFNEKLRPSEQRYWELRPTSNVMTCTSEEAADALEARLKRSVELRLRADVPVGAYVSGGLDSSVIGSLAVRQSGRIETFGIRFDDPRFDETDGQRLVARHLGTSHHELLCRADDICSALAETVWQCETPLLRTSPVPLFLLSAAVRSAGIKTVLTGEGADEFLCGYTIFKEAQIRRFWARYPDSQSRPALLQRIHHYVGTEDARRTALWRSFFAHGLREVDHPLYSHLVRWRNTAWTLRLLAPEIRMGFALEATLTRIAGELPADWLEWPPLLRAQYLEIDRFMSSYLLSCQGDRVAMAHGIEARYPFLDPDLVSFCLTLDECDKQIGTRDKLVLRRLARRYLPTEIWARRKQPFRAPIGSVLFGRKGEAFADLLAPAALAADGHFDLSASNRLLAKVRNSNEAQLSEREEMGLVGILTLRLLNESYGRGYPARAQEAAKRLAKMPCHVLVDRLHGRHEQANLASALIN